MIIIVGLAIGWWYWRHWSPPDLAAWASGAGALAAAAIAPKIADDSANQRSSDKADVERERESRAIRRSRRILVEVGDPGPPPNGDIVVYLTTRVTNSGNTPIYQLRWHPPVVQFFKRGHDPEAVRPQKLFTRIGASTPERVRSVLNPSELHEYLFAVKMKTSMAAHSSAIEGVPFDARVLIAYEDEDGFELGLNGQDGRNPEWVLKPDGYPETLANPVGELIRRAQPTDHA